MISSHRSRACASARRFPDRVFDEADEVELIDLPPDDLLARLKAGKVYPPGAGRRRRRTVLPQGQPAGAARDCASSHGGPRRCGGASRARHGVRTRPWLARDRLLVAVGPDSQAEQLVRAGKRLADALDAQWTVVYVETPELLRLPETERNRRIDLLRLAESLGAETVTLDGPRAAGTLIEYARTRKASRVLVGAPKRRGWRAWLRPSTATELVRRARGFDVITLSMPEQLVHEHLPGADSYAGTPQPINWGRYARALAGTAVCTGVGLIMYPYFELTDVVMVYMLGAAHRGTASRPRARGRRGARQHSRAQLLLRAAAIHVRRERRSVPGHVLGDVDRDPGHRDADGERAAADAGRGCTRAAYGIAVCDEPRACGNARPVEPGYRRSNAHRGSLRQQGGDPAAGREWSAPTSRRIAARLLAARSRPVDRTVGGRPRSARRAGIRYFARRAGAVSAAPGLAHGIGRARSAGGQPAPRPAARAAPPA